ncbi:hypothetical protein BT246_72070 (plasmid) [Bacillus thuringiensis]|uniref:Uncharacterized protein n=1 Tax=Bacillus thuringiensis TaxID=1428 RepID=A0A9W3SJX8_BACTU|nr:hypothetical protein BT246_72070 [Bacillus thuringiensis]
MRKFSIIVLSVASMFTIMLNTGTTEKKMLLAKQKILNMYSI